MPKEYNFKTSLDLGRLGVMLAKIQLEKKYGKIIDYDADKAMQKRGIDVFVPSLGMCEIKTDSHNPDKFYFELEDNGHSGAVFNCTADYYIVFFFKHNIMYVIRRAELVYWLCQHYSWVKRANPKWVHHTVSVNNGHKWNSEGFIIPMEIFTKDVNVGIISWAEEGVNSGKELEVG